MSPKKNRDVILNLCGLVTVMILWMAGCSGSTPIQPTLPYQGSSPSARPPTETTEILSPTATPSSTITNTLVPPSATATVTETPTLTATTQPKLVFAAIGDYGSGEKPEEEVANLILSWQPEIVITLGDNNYPSGAANTMDSAVGQFFHSYIYPYNGDYGAGADVNRFFPCLGNHDVITENGKAYFDYFTLPGNERYYDFTWGPVHFFALDDLGTEPDGVGANSTQAMWLKNGLAASTSEWNIVYMHYPPYSSGTHGSTDWARWPYADWGANAVLAGHDHTYERLEEGGLVYFVNGLGGDSIYDFQNILDGSQVRYNGDFGAMRMEATDTQLTFEFITRAGEVVDTYVLNK